MMILQYSSVQYKNSQEWTAQGLVVDKFFFFTLFGTPKDGEKADGRREECEGGGGGQTIKRQ